MTFYLRFEKQKTVITKETLNLIVLSASHPRNPRLVFLSRLLNSSFPLENAPGLSAYRRGDRRNPGRHSPQQPGHLHDSATHRRPTLRERWPFLSRYLFRQSCRAAPTIA